MGDAGPPTPLLAHGQQQSPGSSEQGTDSSLREVNILVTGFGPFKSFTTNPSFLIASSLPRSLDPSSYDEILRDHDYTHARHFSRSTKQRPYRINIHTHSQAIRVAYASTATTIPHLIASSPSSSPVAPSDLSSPSISSSQGHTEDPASRSAVRYDYVLHIGMAAGRDNYTLETVAHRDHYKIKDIDECEGSSKANSDSDPQCPSYGEQAWKRDNLPDRLDVGWHKEDVVARWTLLAAQAEDNFEAEVLDKAGWKDETITTAMTNDDADTMEVQRDNIATNEMRRARLLTGKGKRAEVKLSKDAGRYLCEYILYTSLSTRWKEARDEEEAGRTGSDVVTPQQTEPASERIGKVAFLHVPGGVSLNDIARGTRMAETAILALIGSWEAGYRNHDVYTK